MLKETPIWEVGCIISNTGTNGGYLPIEDVWTRFPAVSTYYEGKEAVEAPENSKWFERVYPSPTDKLVFVTKEKLTEIYQGKFKP